MIEYTVVTVRHITDRVTNKTHRLLIYLCFGISLMLIDIHDIWN